METLHRKEVPGPQGFQQVRLGAIIPIEQRNALTQYAGGMGVAATGIPPAQQLGNILGKPVFDFVVGSVYHFNLVCQIESRTFGGSSGVVGIVAAFSKGKFWV